MTDKPDQPKPVDITSEEYRVYTYADGRRFTIVDPVSLFVLASDNHRVVDKAGVTHRPTRNWVGLSWKPRDGEPAFVA